MDSARHTCLKLQIHEDSRLFFIKPTHFNLSITDGLTDWTCNALEEEVKERASNWDKPTSEYIDLLERYLGFQQSGSVYGFVDAGGGNKSLSWTFKKEGTKLEWRWKFKPAEDSKKITAGILDFLMDANIRLSFLGVLKSKKAKLRELRDQRPNQEITAKSEEEDEGDSTDKTETFEGDSEDDDVEEDTATNVTTTSKDASKNKPRGRKRK